MIPAGTGLEAIVSLRLAIKDTRDRTLRAELRASEVALRKALGPRVPKRVAARLLGTSVTALERWVDRGYLPVVASPRGLKRLALESGPLLDLATRVRLLRRAGRSRAVLAEAVRELGWRDRGRRIVYSVDVARLPRPNVSLDELQRQFAETTPADRVLQMAALNRAVTALTHGGS
ncbi:MAG TPA: hypothetical protein VGT60_10170 [Candidatus Limnocylindria bacterium]|nr:hypothetical protein [Candidatus Limnocylindria bacterium]